MSASWRLMADLAAADGATNMAVDAALLHHVVEGAAPVVRLYRWTPATLSFGRNQPARGLYDESAARDRGIHFVRRPTGGQAVLHDDELTYAVVAPVDVIGRPRSAYARINQALVAGLRSLGVPAALAEPTLAGDSAPALTEVPPHDWATACFRTPERGEVVVGGRKLVGSAQRTESRVILQHGSILLGGSQSPAEELLLRHAAQRAGPGPAQGDTVRVDGWTTVESELRSRPELEAVVEAVVAGFERALGTQFAPCTLSTPEAEVSRRRAEQFASADWTWRR